MKTFPMFIRLEGRTVVVAGGGEQAAQKTRLLLKTEAAIRIAAPALEPELAALAKAGRIAHLPVLPEATTFAGARLAFVATGCPGADAALADLARTAGTLVNVVDAPDLCDAFTPSIVDRDPVVVAIGSEGTAPVLARQIKARIETLLEPRLGDFAALAGRLRGEVAARIVPERRRAFWDWVFGGGPRAAHARGKERAAAEAVKAALAAGGPPEGADAGLVSLVGAGPGSRDLITLRGVQRLQEADVIYYDRLVDPDLLELARRDAERIYVGKEPGATAWPQERINGVVIAAARRGHRVVRLKSGDPGIFGRGSDETAALDGANIAWEIVSGVTAASAASAETNRFLTERGQTDTLVLTTARVRDGDEAPEWAGHALPGTTLAFYMATGSGAEIRDRLLAGGIAKDAPLDVVSRAAFPDCRVIGTTVGDLAETLEAHPGLNPAVLLLRLAKSERLQDSSVQPPRQAHPDGEP